MVAKKEEEYDLGLSLGGVYKIRGRAASLPTSREMELMRERLTEVQALSNMMAASLKLTSTIHDESIRGAVRLPRLASAGGSGRLAATSSTVSGELMSTNQSSDRSEVNISLTAKENNADDHDPEHDPSRKAGRRYNRNIARAITPIRRYRRNVNTRMPHVKTIGADGKRVEGYLYKYLTGKVRIVCVCHGFFQSPAEFVNHAGGNVVGNPLKQITVSL